jgi:hypothetical protein
MVKDVAEVIVPIVCRHLATMIMEEHENCIRWDNETSNVRECSHLQDANLILKFAHEWKTHA